MYIVQESTAHCVFVHFLCCIKICHQMQSFQETPISRCCNCEPISEQAVSLGRMAIFPAVLVDNLPRHLQQNTKKAANVLLGQDRREMMFWRLHTDAPNFLVVFRDTEERNAYYHSPFLQEVRGPSESVDYSCNMESFKVTLVRWLAEKEWTQASVYTARYSLSVFPTR